MIKTIEVIKKGGTTYTIKYNSADDEYSLYQKDKNHFNLLVKEAKRLSTIKRHIKTLKK